MICEIREDLGGHGWLPICIRGRHAPALRALAARGRRFQTAGIPVDRESGPQMTMVASRFRNACRRLYAVEAEVFGLALAGPDMMTRRSPIPLVASNVPVLPAASGSATSRTIVESSPNPANATVAARLAFLG